MKLNPLFSPEGVFSPRRAWARPVARAMLPPRLRRGAGIAATGWPDDWTNAAARNALKFMPAQDHSASFAEFLPVRVGAYKAAAIAFGLGFLGGLASTGTTAANFDCSLETLGALVFGLAVGLISAAATCIFALVCCGIRAQFAPRLPAEPVSGGTAERAWTEDVMGWFCFGMLAVIVLLSVLIKHVFTR